MGGGRERTDEVSILDGISIFGRGSRFRDGVRVCLESDGNTLGNFESCFQGPANLHVVFSVPCITRPNGQFVTLEEADRTRIKSQFYRYQIFVPFLGQTKDIFFIINGNTKCRYKINRDQNPWRLSLSK